MAFDVGELKPELLYVVVFGPGYGESVVLRIPPNSWLVIDSTQVPLRNGVNPAAQLLERERAEWSCAVLSHPHEDHAAGFDVLLDQPGDGPIACVEANLASVRVDETNADAEALLRRGTTQAALAAISDRWERFPDRRWPLVAGTGRTFGDAVVEVLAPDAELIAQSGRSPNDLASPLRVTWRGHDWLFGADLEHPGWCRVVARGHHDLGEHLAFRWLTTDRETASTPASWSGRATARGS